MLRCDVLFGSVPLPARGLVLLALCFAAGCGLGEVEEEPEPEIPDWVSTDATEESSRRHRLALNVQPGDRFPLRKVIEKEVIQEMPDGPSQINRLRIELTLGVTVEEVTDGRTKFHVRYDRVQYRHRLPDEVVEYDSQNRPRQLPLSILAWDAMVGDGFSFWVGRDNQIAGVEGFREFLDRCLSVIPAERRDEVVLSIESTSGENGVSDFIDNAIGLLPADARKSPGESWRRSRHIRRPVPMHLNTVYTLKEIDDDLAVVQIEGEITPSTTLVDTDGSEARRVRMTVQNGSTWGRCDIFRNTGLPKQSRVEHEIVMTVQMSGGGSFEQRVRGVTTIQAFPVASEQGPRIIGQRPERTSSARR